MRWQGGHWPGGKVVVGGRVAASRAGEGSEGSEIVVGESECLSDMPRTPHKTRIRVPHSAFRCFGLSLQPRRDQGRRHGN